jgi:hypothetical protein
MLHCFFFLKKEGIIVIYALGEGISMFFNSFNAIDSIIVITMFILCVVLRHMHQGVISLLQSILDIMVKEHTQIHLTLM